MLGGNFFLVVFEVDKQDVCITNDRDHIILGPCDHLH